MKKAVLFLVIVLVSKVSYSQDCKLSFEQFTTVIDFEQSEFENFALKNGFSYNTQTKNYICDVSDSIGNRNTMIHGEQDGVVALLYSFHDKSEYLVFKGILEKGKLVEIVNEADIYRLEFMLNGSRYFLQTSTINSINTYMISFAKSK